MLVLKITGIHRETDNCKTFTFHSSSEVKYEAGQFLTFLFEIKGREIRRSYSLSSSPYTGEPLSITIKLTSNSEISRWWIYEAKMGDTLKALPPSGLFSPVWQKKPRDIFLTAAGSGITPLYSILQSALIQEPQSHIVLIYSNSNKSAAIFIDRLKDLEKKFKNNLSVFWLFSDNKDLQYARLGTYSLQRIITASMQYQYEDAVMFSCGPFGYMQNVQITWLTMGFPKNSFRKELFDSDAQPPLPRSYYDKQDRMMTIVYNGKPVSLLVPYNQTILDAALQSGIDMPYSCKAGRCSTCKCRVLSGTVWMHYNEVLLDEDEAKGLSLTCTGHPASADVVIEI